MNSNRNLEEACLKQQGPRPFVTRRVHSLRDGALAVWSSRHHRKRLFAPELLPSAHWRKIWRAGWWMPTDLNWWIGLIFAVGASLFILGSWLTLSTDFQQRLGLNANAVFFAGSIPFTIAAYLQLYQAANTPPLPNEDADTETPRRWIGWRPQDIGWWSCLFQWVGTLLFNVNTYDGMDPNLTWIQQDVWIWIPNIVGSILFMISGYMAFAETCHGYWRWNPGNISWWVVTLNLAGCVGFLVSACLAVVVSDQPATIRENWSVLFTLQGAFGFLLGSLMMLPEAACKAPLVKPKVAI